MNDQLQDDMTARFVPTDEQIAVAVAMLEVAEEATHVVVPLALPGKTRGVWTVGQPVEHVPGFWLVDADQTSVGHRGAVLGYRTVCRLADQAAAAHLGARPGVSAYATIDVDGQCSTREGYITTGSRRVDLNEDGTRPAAPEPTGGRA